MLQCCYGCGSWTGFEPAVERIAGAGGPLIELRYKVRQGRHAAFCLSAVREKVFRLTNCLLAASLTPGRKNSEPEVLPQDEADPVAFRGAFSPPIPPTLSPAADSPSRSADIRSPRKDSPARFPTPAARAPSASARIADRHPPPRRPPRAAAECRARPDRCDNPPARTDSRARLRSRNRASA